MDIFESVLNGRRETETDRQTDRQTESHGFFSSFLTHGSPLQHASITISLSVFLFLLFLLLLLQIYSVSSLVSFHRPQHCVTKCSIVYSQLTLCCPFLKSPLFSDKAKALYWSSAFCSFLISIAILRHLFLCFSEIQLISLSLCFFIPNKVFLILFSVFSSLCFFILFSVFSSPFFSVFDHLKQIISSLSLLSLFCVLFLLSLSKFLNMFFSPLFPSDKNMQMNYIGMHGSIDCQTF